MIPEPTTATVAEVFDGGPSPAVSEASAGAREPIQVAEGERPVFDGGGATT
jgi:hypothetical protein